MHIVGVRILDEKIEAYGDSFKSPAGHNFTLEAEVEVKSRTLGAFSGEGIDCPTLEWNEVIEWFEYDRRKNSWNFVGRNAKNMYEHQPTSPTFKYWHANRYYMAIADPSNKPPPGLAMMKNNKDAKHWIAKNGFKWKIPIKDVPGMGVKAGSGGGGGASMLTGDTRRRIIYFDLGFSGSPIRAKCVQILETFDGELTIHKFVNQYLLKSYVDDPLNLEKWRGQYGQIQDWKA